MSQIVPQALDATATYVITGGSGGLGLLFASWMVQSGAQCVILLGRSGRVAAAADLLPLAHSSAQVIVLRSDVSRGEEAAAAAAAAASINRRLAGVIHAAGLMVRVQPRLAMLCVRSTGG